MSFAVAREVRVTARRSVTMPFVPSDLSPVQRHLAIDHQGERDWTDMDVKAPSVLPKFPRHRDNYNVGTAVIRKVSSDRKVRVLNATGPSAEYRRELANSRRLTVNGGMV